MSTLILSSVTYRRFQESKTGSETKEDIEMLYLEGYGLETWAPAGMGRGRQMPPENVVKCFVY